jgi:hypothetical protein
LVIRGGPDERGAERVASLPEVFRVLNDMRSDGVIEDYALGGAMAVLFYAEPTRTYDLDVFVILPPPEQPIVTLRPVYAWLRARGFEAHAEHVLIHGVPVQFMPAYNELVEEAIAAARDHDYDDVTVRVCPPEHLIALALQAGGGKRRERAHQLLETADIDRALLDEIMSRHGVRWSRDA